MAQQGRRTSVRDRSAGQGSGSGEATATRAELEVIDNRIKAGKGYYNAVSPAFLTGDAFAAMAIGYLHARPKLAAAVVRNPGSFLAALSECARQGLVLGETYHIAGPFWDKETQTNVCVGMRDYKGEIELMYRSGGVRTVVYDVIRQNDYFKRGKHPHEAPEFAPLDEGLASEDERGPLKGAFAYAILESGVPSRVVVMGRDEMMRHREASKRPQALWDGPWEISAWLKTVIHELRKGVPISAEYRVDQYRAMIAASQLPSVEIAQAGGDLQAITDDTIDAPSIEPVPGTYNGAVDGEPGDQASPPERQGRQRRKGRREPTNIGEVVKLMDEIGIAADDRVPTVQAILPKWQPTEPPVLDDTQHEAVLAKLRQFAASADPEQELTALHAWREFMQSPPADD